MGVTWRFCLCQPHRICRMHQRGGYTTPEDERPVIGMKAIVNKTKLCVIVEDAGDGLWLEPVEGSNKDRFWLQLCDPDLIVDPTDDEVEALDMWL